MDAPHNADLAYWEKAERKFHKNAASYIEHILKAASYKEAAVRPSISRL